MKSGWAAIPELYHLPGFYEPFSAISHLLGAAIFLVLGLLLLQRGLGDRTRLIYLGVLVASCRSPDPLSASCGGCRARRHDGLQDRTSVYRRWGCAVATFFAMA